MLRPDALVSQVSSWKVLVVGMGMGLVTGTETKQGHSQLDMRERILRLPARQVQSQSGPPCSVQLYLAVGNGGVRDDSSDSDVSNPHLGQHGPPTPVLLSPILHGPQGPHGSLQDLPPSSPMWVTQDLLNALWHFKVPLESTPRCPPGPCGGGMV